MIFVTGAAGFVGAWLVRRLAERSTPVRCLVLPRDPIDALEPLPVEIVRGDVTDVHSLLPHGRGGVSAIVHSAALMPPSPGADILRVNVEGTSNMIRVARECGVSRFVYLSAVSAVYAEKNVYGLSKERAERLVRESGLDYTILRPTMIYGPNGGSHFRKLLSLIERVPVVLPVPGPGTALLQPVWIGDVVDAIERVLREPRAVGKAYNVSGATALSLDDLLDRMLAASRIRRLKVHVPLWLCEAGAAVLALSFGHTVLSRDAFRGINQDATLDHSELRADCGYCPISLEDGLKAALGDCPPEASQQVRLRTSYLP